VIYFLRGNIPLPRLGVIPTRVRDSINSIWDWKIRYEMAHQQRIIFRRQHYRRHHSTDRTERACSFADMLQHELRGRELPADANLRRIAERAWHQFLKRGWPT
jgi:hypothetical protein